MEKFDAIIIGGGLSGLAAAYTLGQAGLEVLVLERGDYCGAKNVTGGRLYVNPIRDYFPELWSKAPLERFIAHEEVNLMALKRSMTIRYDGQELAAEPHQSYSILRAKFDKWFAKQAESKGAMLVSKSRVDDLVFDQGKVIGVRADGDELLADVVIACDGVLSFFAAKAGLRAPHNPHNFAVGFKEIVELDRETLENRFNLTGNEGTARLFMGDATGGKFGGGFLYTNQASVSLGIVAGITEFDQDKDGTKAYELLDRFKQRPEVACLIRGGQTAEYSAHVIPEGGLKAMGKLFGDGILVAGDAAGFSMNIGITVRGMDYAMASGHLAAKTVIQAKERNDFSAVGLSAYENMLADSFVMADFRNFKDALHILDYSRLFQVYPELFGGIMRDLYEVPNGPKSKLVKSVREHFTFKDVISFGKDFWRLKGL